MLSSTGEVRPGGFREVPGDVGERKPVLLGGTVDDRLHVLSVAHPRWKSS